MEHDVVALPGDALSSVVSLSEVLVQQEQVNSSQVHLFYSHFFYY